MKQEHGWKVPNKNVTLRFSIGSDDDAAAPSGQAAPPHAAPSAQGYAAPAAHVYAPPANAYAASSYDAPSAPAPQPIPVAVPHAAPVMQAPQPHQHQHHAPSQHKEEDIRVKLLGTIWGCATGMLGICIPLMAIAQDASGGFAAVLPLGVVAGAATATIAVLSHFKGSASSASVTHDAQQTARLHELEERLANMETINSFERRLAEDALARDRAGVPTAPIARDAVTPAETTYHFLEPEATQTAR